jgi:ATP synthase protein I
MRSDNVTQQVTSAVNDGWMEGGSFFGSIVAGTLLGYFADRWLGTDPWLVVTGIVLGAYSGFVRVWHYSKKLEEMSRDR